MLIFSPQHFFFAAYQVKAGIESCPVRYACCGLMKEEKKNEAFLFYGG